MRAARAAPCNYAHQDLRLADYGEGFGLVMLIFGEFNIFRPSDARNILLKARRALDDGGLLLLEPHTFSAVQKIGEQGLVWSSAERGLFSDRPYIYLVESIWNAATHHTVTRYFIIDAASGQVKRYAQTFRAYSNAEYESFLVECARSPSPVCALGRVGIGIVIGIGIGLFRIRERCRFRQKGTGEV